MDPQLWYKQYWLESFLSLLIKFQFSAELEPWALWSIFNELYPPWQRCFCFCFGAGYWTQDCLCIKHTLHHLATPSTFQILMLRNNMPFHNFLSTVLRSALWSINPILFQIPRKCYNAVVENTDSGSQQSWDPRCITMSRVPWASYYLVPTKPPPHLLHGNSPTQCPWEESWNKQGSWHCALPKVQYPAKQSLPGKALQFSATSILTKGVK